MKSINNIWILAVIVTLFSCNDLVDIEAENTVSGDILTDEASIQKALNGAYFNFFGISDGASSGELLGGDFQMMATLLTRQNTLEIAWDQTNAPDYENFIDKDIQSVNGRVEANWRRAYETISLANDILKNIDNVSSTTARGRIQGEALAIRGILYFEMVRFWGDQYRSSTENTPAIPLILEPITSLSDIETPTPSTVSQVYAQVEEDLAQASTLLEPFGTNSANLSYYAVEAYMARVLLQKNDFDNALPHLDNVIGGPFSLVDTPVEAFNNASNSSEDILAIPQTPTSNTGDNSSGAGLATLFSSLSDFGLSAMRVIPASLNSTILSNNPEYSNDDLRAEIDTTTTESTDANDISTLYYRDPVNTITISSAKFMNNTTVVPVIRLSEMLLDRAEAQLEFDLFTTVDDQALADLNAVRTRAGLDALLDTISPDAFYDSLIVERNRELLYEGVVFHDLKRWSVFNRRFTQITFGNDPLDEKFILPIPQSECDASPGLCAN